jgi:phosphate-selective porin
MKMKKQLLIMMFAAALASAASLKSLAQEVNIQTGEPKMSKDDSLRNEIEPIRSLVEKLSKIKISGYIQGQFQYAEWAGINSFEGGNFPAASDKRFSVRRGRLKVMYDNTYTQMAIQIDATEKGVTLKDAYALLKDPFLHAFGLTVGVFNRPFGFEVPYSSSLRESPERARWEQTIFPGERDLGAMITFNPPSTSRFNWIKVNAGLFCGNGINSETDKRKDFIGQISLNRSAWGEKIKWGVGVSYYNGGVYQGNKFKYTLNTLADGSTGFTVDSTDSNKGKYAHRDYYGADVQFSIDWPAGITTLRGEFVTGAQPAGPILSSSPNAGVIVPTDTYMRPFMGYNAYFIQNIAHSKHDILVKYDSYDPNTEVSGMQIASKYTDGGVQKNTKLSAADIKYDTWGFGYIFHWDQNIKITAYYAMVKNEKTALTNYENDLKDNVFTLRVQYKF